jgi:pimeloyl-ACP methyl ester carboxylesterase
VRTPPILPAAVLAAALLAGCSGGSSGAEPEAATGPATSVAPDEPTTTTAPAPTAEAFAGSVDDFYAVPDPLPDGEHGTLVRYQPMDDYEVEGATTYRIMYLSESLPGDRIVVTGMASVPDAAPPADGRPMITIAHGTTGIADACAPSKSPVRTEMSLVAAAMGTEHLIAYTDYEGLGTPGRHPYLVGESEGRSAIDAIVAAGQLPDAAPGTKLGIAGYSQGGHGALWASQVAAEWAPDLEVVGTFAGAPASEVGLTLAAAPRLPQAGFAYMVIAGIAEAYPDEADLEALLTPRGIELLDVVDEGCTGEVFAAVSGIPVTDLIRPEGASSEPWRSLARAQDAAQVKTNDAPTLVIHSEQDAVVPLIFSAALTNRMCANGQVIERRLLPEGSHTSAAVPAYEQATEWLAERFATDPPEPVSSCEG